MTADTIEGTSNNSDSPTSKPMDQPDDSKWMMEDFFPKEKENQHLTFWHDVIVHRYDYEIGRMNNLKYQATFILGAVGVIITLWVNIYTSDRFSFHVNQISMILLALFTLIPLLRASYLALIAFHKIHNQGYCGAYPNNKHIDAIISYSYNFPSSLNLDLIKINSDLADTIKRNDNHNDDVRDILLKSQRWFYIGIICTIISPIMILIIIPIQTNLCA